MRRRVRVRLGRCGGVGGDRAGPVPHPRRPRDRARRWSAANVARRRASGDRRTRRARRGGLWLPRRCRVLLRTAAALARAVPRDHDAVTTWLPDPSHYPDQMTPLSATVWFEAMGHGLHEATRELRAPFGGFLTRTELGWAFECALPPEWKPGPRLAGRSTASCRPKGIPSRSGCATRRSSFPNVGTTSCGRACRRSPRS